MPKKIDWTEEKIAELKDLHNRVRVEKVAEHFGITIVAMYAAFRKFGLSKPRKERTDRTPVGTISHRKNGVQYIMLETGWALHSAHLWTSAGLEIPPKHKLCYKDGNPHNCTLDNLELKTMRDIALISVKVRPRKGDPNSKTAIRIREQEKRRLERIERKKEKSVKEKQEWMTPARKAQLERMWKKNEERGRIAQAKREAERKRQREEKERLRIESQWLTRGRKHAKKEEVNRLSTKVVDYSQMKRVQVDKKTWVYLKPGQKAEEVIRKYQKAA